MAGLTRADEIEDHGFLHRPSLRGSTASLQLIGRTSRQKCVSDYVRCVSPKSRGKFGRFPDSKKPGGDQVAEEDAGGDDDDVHEPVERSLFVHYAWGQWLREALYAPGFKFFSR